LSGELADTLKQQEHHERVEHLEGKCPKTALGCDYCEAEQIARKIVANSASHKPRPRLDSPGADESAGGGHHVYLYDRPSAILDPPNQTITKEEWDRQNAL
jgi:hypothetical protein